MFLWIYEAWPVGGKAASSAQAEAEALVVDVVARFAARLEEEGLREVERLLCVAIDAQLALDEAEDSLVDAWL